MVRKEDGLFRGRGFNSNITKLSDSFFSLLKFDPSDDDDDFSKNCLVANLSVNSKYLTVFPVDCDSKVANAFICFRFFSYCGLYKNRIQEQTDLLFDPVQKQNLDYYIMKETNEIYDSIKSLNRLRFILFNQCNKYSKIR